MPFVANTPESLLNRSDSKNPQTTCRGITSSGRPCRRPVTSAAASSADTSSTGRFLSSRPPPVANRDPRDESLYCWQHKEQAQAASSARSSPGPRRSSHATPIIEERTSIDTLADRLGLVDLESKRKHHNHHSDLSGSPQSKPHNGNGRRTSGGGGGTYIGVSPSKPPVLSRPKPRKTLQFCWFFSIPIEEVGDSPAPRPRPQPRPVQNNGIAPNPLFRPARPSTSKPPPSSSQHSPGRRPSTTASQTARYLSLIPPTTDPPTASALMAELARPYVDSEEPGFIYMFWMTPDTEPRAPPVDAARSLLAPPSASRDAARQRRPSDVVSSFAARASASPARGNDRGATDIQKKTMLLKIGRAANVQRRMQQWSRQCGYDIEVIRFYPYLPGASDSSSSSGAVPRMTPHCKRVERLVHIELAGLGLRAKLDACGACGKEHREWFTVSATREGISAVDAVIRRWVDWDESIP